MPEIVLRFAGRDRSFHLRLGEMADVEQACGSVGIGAIFQRLATSEFFAMDIRHVLTFGLVGGGMTRTDAEKLVRDQMDAKPLFQLAATAQDVLVAAMTGVAPTAQTEGGDPREPLDLGKLFHALLQVGLSPAQVREMQYRDLIALTSAAGGSDLQPPSEEEVADMIRRFDEREALRASHAGSDRDN